MKFFEIRYILEIADTGSITKAADRLYMAQSSLSQFLARYEKSLGYRLFERTAQGVAPTPAGALYIDALRQADKILQEADRRISDMLGGPAKRSLTFGISAYRVPTVFPSLQKSFCQMHPDVQIRIVEGSAEALEDMLLASELDCAVLGLPITHRELLYSEICEEDLILGCQMGHAVCGEAHEETGRLPWVDYECMERYPLILLDSHTRMRKILDSVIAKHGLHPNVIHEASNIYTAIELANRGVGLVVLPDSFVHNTKTSMALYRIGQPPLHRSFVIAFPPDTKIGLFHHDLERCVTEVFAAWRREASLPA